MALDDGSAVEPGIAHFFYAPANTAAPTTAAVLALTSTNPTLTGYTNLGHTSLENDTAPFVEGGESTIRGSRQKPQLRESVAATVRGMDLSSIQTTSEILTFFYGGGTVYDGYYEPPTVATPQQRAFLAVYFDGTEVIAEHRPLVSIRANGAYRNAASGWFEWPLRVTYLTGSTADRWIGEMFDAP